MVRRREFAEAMAAGARGVRATARTCVSMDRFVPSSAPRVTWATTPKSDVSMVTGRCTARATTTRSARSARLNTPTAASTTMETECVLARATVAGARGARATIRTSASMARSKLSPAAPTTPVRVSAPVVVVSGVAGERLALCRRVSS